MEDNAVKEELATLFGEREKPTGRPMKAGGVTMLTIVLCLSVALAAWPFVKTLLQDPPPENTSLYYKGPVDSAITQAVLEEVSFDILCFAGCAHHRHAKKTIPFNESGQREI